MRNHEVPERPRAAVRVIWAAVVVFLLSPFLLDTVPAESVSPEWSDVIGSVSGVRIMQTIQDLEDFRSRAFPLNTSEEVAMYLHERFEELGLETSFQNFTFSGHAGSNVVAVLPGRGPDIRTIVMGAHYDSENQFATNLPLTENLSAPGADDDASGVAAVVELATVLKGMTSNDTLKFVAFAAEELGYDQTGGLQGSSQFAVSEKISGAVYESAIVLDMIGYRSSSENRMTIINENSSDVFAPEAARAVAAYGLDLVVDVKTNQHIDYSDHWSFWDVGYQAVLVTEELNSDSYPYPVNPYYHTSDDTSDTLSEPQITEVTRCVAATVLELAGAEDIAEEEADLGATAALVSLVAVAIAVPIVFRAVKSKRRRDHER